MMQPLQIGSIVTHATYTGRYAVLGLDRDRAWISDEDTHGHYQTVLIADLTVVGYKKPRRNLMDFAAWKTELTGLGNP